LRTTIQLQLKCERKKKKTEIFSFKPIRRDAPISWLSSETHSTIASYVNKTNSFPPDYQVANRRHYWRVPSNNISIFPWLWGVKQYHLCQPTVCSCFIERKFYSNSIYFPLLFVRPGTILIVGRERIGFVDIRCNCRVGFRKQSRNGGITTNRFEAKYFCFLFLSFAF
jgi:hypothetical protein